MRLIELSNDCLLYLFVRNTTYNVLDVAGLNEFVVDKDYLTRLFDNSTVNSDEGFGSESFKDSLQFRPSFGCNCDFGVGGIRIGGNYLFDICDAFLFEFLGHTFGGLFDFLFGALLNILRSCVLIRFQEVVVEFCSVVDAGQLFNRFFSFCFDVELSR